MYKPMTVTIKLDGSGVYYDTAEPITLDGLLGALLCRWHNLGEPPARDEKPKEVPLPLGTWRAGGAWGYRASALFPAGVVADGESLRSYRRRFRQDRAHIVNGSANSTMGTYRDWNITVPLLLTHELVGYAFGDVRKVRRALTRDLRYVGKKRAQGVGRVVGVEVVDVEQDYSCVMEGVAMRWLPKDGAPRRVRTRAPYWNIVGAVPCCEIGELYDASLLEFSSCEVE